MFTHFVQKDFAPVERGIFIAGDDVSWTPGWAEGAVQTALERGVGASSIISAGGAPASNPGPGDRFEALKPIDLDA